MADIQDLATPIVIDERKYTSDRFDEVDADELYGCRFTPALVAADNDGKISRQLVVNHGANEERDIRVRAVFLNEIPSFEQIKKYTTVDEFESVFFNFDPRHC